MKTVIGWDAPKFDKNFLKSLKENVNSGVQVQKVQHHLALHPIQLHDLNKSVKDSLNGGLGKYNKKLGGLVLGYRNVKLLSDKGLIVNDSCYIHIDLLVEFFIFKPEVDKEMHGVVNKKSKNHIGVLAYNRFNVSIPNPKDDDNWLGNNVNLGQEVIFCISRINLLSHLPYIGGTLKSVVSNTDIEDNTLQESKGTKRKSKKLSFEGDSIDETAKKKLKKKNKKDIDKSTENTSKKGKKSVDEGITEEVSRIKKLEDSLSDEEIPSKKRKIKKEREEVQESDQSLSWEEIKYELEFDDVTEKKEKKQKHLNKKKKSKQARESEDSFSNFVLLNSDIKNDAPSTPKMKSKKMKSVKRELDNNLLGFGDTKQSRKKIRIKEEQDSEVSS